MSQDGVGPIVVPQEGESEDLDYTLAAPPEDPVTPAGRWMRENLFSSKSNSIQTVIFGGILLFLLRWILSLVFADEARWSSVATNIRLLFTYNYPAEQFVRIWVTTGALFAAVGLSFAAWNLSPSLTLRRIGSGFIGTGVVLLVMGAVTPNQTPDGIRIGMFVLGAASAAAGWVILHVVEDPHTKFVRFETVLLVLSALVIALLWLFPLGRYEFLEGETIQTSGTINETTKTPWTMLILILHATFFGGRALGKLIGHQALRMAMIIWWVIGPAFLIFLVLRDPAFDWGYIARVDLPIAAAFAIGGGALLYALTKPGFEEKARVIGALLIAFAAFTWVGGFFGWFAMLQKVRLSFLFIALFALMAPTFSGEKSARLRFAGAWFGLIVVSHWLITGINTPSTLDITAPPFLGGFVLTVSIAYYVMLASFPLGVMLALARTSKMPIFRVMSTIYIEFVRGIPLITVLFFFSIMLPLFLPDGMGISELAAIFTGYAMFSAAYMAENIRGGLQSVRKGQYEAADALGLTTVQRTSFIVLPQALRVSIPNLVGQAIATFKETSLIAIVGGFDLLRIADKTIPAQTDFIGQKRPALLFISLVYWVFAYSMSRASRNLEHRLGVGQGR
jgi:His/Glu/Gln/Arg/opine family amino acid ABC transporter permease subunit